MIRRREIDLDDDLPFTRRSWTAERVGWAVLWGLLAAGLLGFLGPGAFSGVRAEGPVTAEYERFERLDTPGELRVRLAPGTRVLWIENLWLEDVGIERIFPEPLRVSSEPGWTVFTFAGREDVEARLDILPRRAGRVEGRFGVSPERTVTVRQFVYP